MPLTGLVTRLGLAVWFAAAISVPAKAQDVIVQKALSLELARAIAEGALEKCRADGYHVTVTVVDRDGLVKAALRDDGTGAHTIATSRRKAFTSASFKVPSGEWAKHVLTELALAGLRDAEGVIALGGGVPIKAGDEVIGGIGVSGAPGGEKDEACSNAGVQKLAEKLK